MRRKGHNEKDLQVTSVEWSREEVTGGMRVVNHAKLLKTIFIIGHRHGAC